MLDAAGNVAATDLYARSTGLAPRFVVRAIRPDDETKLGAFFRGLSPASRHRRFLAVINELPAELLAHFARPDGHTEVALVATTGAGGNESIVGEARFVGAGGCDCAEFALVVSDGAQRRGLGQRLLRSLIQRALDNDIACLYGDVLPDNHLMLDLVRKYGFSEGRNPADPRLLRVSKTLNPSPAG
jgi:acetyltransferase